MNYRQPFTGTYPISQKFGEKYTDPKGHTGIDYACPAGTPVLASNDGLVFYSGWKESGYGYCVFIKHDDGYVTIYEHLLKDIPVAMAQRVLQGQVIGFSGSTGNSTGPHLHFEMRDENGKAIDPMLKLMSVTDIEKSPLKGADKLPEYIQVVAPSGARRFNEDWSFPYPSTFHIAAASPQRIHRSHCRLPDTVRIFPRPACRESAFAPDTS